MVDRFLNFMSIDDRETHGLKLGTFNFILLLTIAVHQVADERLHWAGLILACALLGLNQSYRRGATAVVFGVLLVRYGFDFPSVANHSYLELLLLFLYLWTGSSKTEERELFLQACRWLTVIIFFYSGVQKVWYGEYFDGRYLAYLAGNADRSRTAFEFLIPPDEMARLINYRRDVGSGPFLIDSAVFKVVSNSAWISEIALSLFLLFRWTWPLAVACAIFTMFIIEFIAREFIFGILIISLLFLFCRRDMNRPLLPVYIIALADFGAVRLCWGPWLYWV